VELPLRTLGFVHYVSYSCTKGGLLLIRMEEVELEQGFDPRFPLFQPHMRLLVLLVLIFVIRRSEPKEHF